MGTVTKQSAPNIALIGVGLIGGSFVQALRQHDRVGHVVGVGRGEDNLKLAKSLGIIDRYTFDIGDAVKNADIVMISTPVGATEAVLKAMMPHLADETIVTDVGSVKAAVVQVARSVMGDQIDQFVPVHPIAGSETSGAGAATPDLFVDHQVIVTPLSETRTAFVDSISALWALTGAQVAEMDENLHDQILGVTSHLPHVLVYALIDYLSKQPQQEAHYKFAAGGLYDLTRIASSDAVMWRDICLNNSDNLVKMMRDYAQDINHLADKIETGESAQVQDLFQHAKQVRAKLARVRKQS